MHEKMHADKILLIPATGEVGATGKDQLSPAALARVNGALRQWRRGEYQAIIVSGGIRWASHRQTVSEGALLSAALIEAGVPPEAIITEETSADCYEVVAHAIELIHRRFRGPVPLTTIVSGKRSCRCAARIFKAFCWFAFNSADVEGGDVPTDTLVTAAVKQIYATFDGCGAALPARINRRAVQLRAQGVL